MGIAYNIFTNPDRRRQVRAYLITAAPPAVYTDAELTALHVPDAARVPLYVSPPRTVLSDDWVKQFIMYASWTLSDQVPVTCAGIRLRWEPVPGMTELYANLGFVLFDQPIALTITEPVLSVHFDVCVARQQRFGG